MSTVGENIKRKRIQNNLSQNKLSKLSGIAQATLSAIESSTKSPSVDTVEKLAYGLGCSVVDLLGHADASSEPDPMTARLLSAFRQLNTAGRQFLIQQAETVLAQPAFRQDNTIQSAI